MSLVKDTVGVEDKTLAGGIKAAAGLAPGALGVPVALVGEILDADANREATLGEFKSQLAGMLGINPAEVTADRIETELKDLPQWFQEEWKETGDVTGKTMNFAVRAGAGVAAMMVAGFIFPHMLLMSIPAGFAGGWFLSDMVEKEFRVAKGDDGGIPVTNLSKVIKQMTASGQTPDPTLTATLILITSRPQDNTEELEKMVDEHLATKGANPNATTDLEGWVHSNQGYLLEQLGKDVQSKFRPGTEVQHIVASYLPTPKDVDILMFKPEHFYEEIAADVSKQHIAQMQARLKQHGQALLHDKDGYAAAPLVSNSHPHKRGEQRGA